MARSAREQTGVDPGPEELVIEPEPSATEDDRPEWLDPKFSSLEDQARAYGEAQREMSRAQQAERQAQERWEEYAAALEAQQQYQPQQPAQMPQQGMDPAFTIPQLHQVMQEALETGDAMTALQVNAFLAKSVASQEFEQGRERLRQELLQEMQAVQGPDMQSQNFAWAVEQQVAARYGDEWQSLKGEVGDLLNQKPHLIPDDGDMPQTVDALIDAVEIVRARKGATAREAAVDMGRQQKMLAQGVTGSSGRQDQQQVQVADHLQDLMRKV